MWFTTMYAVYTPMHHNQNNVQFLHCANHVSRNTFAETDVSPLKQCAVTTSCANKCSETCSPNTNNMTWWMLIINKLCQIWRKLGVATKTMYNNCEHYLTIRLHNASDFGCTALQLRGNRLSLPHIIPINTMFIDNNKCDFTIVSVTMRPVNHK